MDGELSDASPVSASLAFSQKYREARLLLEKAEQRQKLRMDRSLNRSGISSRSPGTSGSPGIESLPGTPRRRGGSGGPDGGLSSGSSYLSQQHLSSSTPSTPRHRSGSGTGGLSSSPASKRGTGGTSSNSPAPAPQPTRPDGHRLVMKVHRSLQDLNDKKWKLLERVVGWQAREQTLDQEIDGVSVREYLNAVENAELIRSMARDRVRHRVQQMATLCKTEARKSYFVETDRLLHAQIPEDPSSEQIAEKAPFAIDEFIRQKDDLEQRAMETDSQQQQRVQTRMKDSIVDHHLETYSQSLAELKEKEYPVKTRRVQNFLQETGLTQDLVLELLRLDPIAVTEETKRFKFIDDTISRIEGSGAAVVDAIRQSPADRKVAVASRRVKDFESESDAALRQIQNDMTSFQQEMDELKTLVEQREKEIVSLEEQNRGLKQELEELDSKQTYSTTDVAAEIEQLKQQILKKESALTALSSEHAAIEGRYVPASSRCTRITRDHAEQKARLEEQKREGQVLLDTQNRTLKDLQNRHRLAEESANNWTKQMERKREQLSQLHTLDRSQRAQLQHDRDEMRMQVERENQRCQAIEQQIATLEVQLASLSEAATVEKRKAADSAAQNNSRLQSLHREMCQLLDDLKSLQTGKTKLKVKKGESWEMARADLMTTQSRLDTMQDEAAMALAQSRVQRAIISAVLKTIEDRRTQLQAKMKSMTDLRDTSLLVMKEQYEALRDEFVRTIALQDAQEQMMRLRNEFTAKQNRLSQFIPTESGSEAGLLSPTNSSTSTS